MTVYWSNTEPHIPFISFLLYYFTNVTMRYHSSNNYNYNDGVTLFSETRSGGYHLVASMILRTRTSPVCWSHTVMTPWWHSPVIHVTIYWKLPFDCDKTQIQFMTFLLIRRNSFMNIFICHVNIKCTRYYIFVWVLHHLICRIIYR